MIVDILELLTEDEMWKVAWIKVELVTMPDGLSIKPLAFCYHPDNTCFYVTSSPYDAVNAFDREEFSFEK